VYYTHAEEERTWPLRRQHESTAAQFRALGPPAAPRMGSPLVTFDDCLNTEQKHAHCACPCPQRPCCPGLRRKEFQRTGRRAGWDKDPRCGDRRSRRNEESRGAHRNRHLGQSFDALLAKGREQKKFGSPPEALRRIGPYAGDLLAALTSVGPRRLHRETRPVYLRAACPRARS
jgi:hypothetical protein